MGEFTVCLKKLTYFGQTILDLSKTVMYKFHYEYIKPMYGERARLLFTDTDSLCYAVKTEDFYKDISNDVHKMFDTTNYPENHPSGISTGVNKRVVGMMKDKSGDKQITEFAGLRSKLYAFKVWGEEEKKNCNGVNKNVVKKCMTLEYYKYCLFNNTNYLAKFNTSRSRKHEITNECITEVALSASDDKRYIIPNNLEHKTLAFGHWGIKHPDLYRLNINTKKMFQQENLANFIFEALVMT